VRFVLGAVSLVAAAWYVTPAGAQTHTENFAYDIEWRFIQAGVAVMDLKPEESRVKLDSAGLVSTLFKVNDTYTAHYDLPYCATSSLMDAQEGRRHRETTITFDRARKLATFTLKDLLRNTIERTEHTAIPDCVHDVVGALQTLRVAPPEVGQTRLLPISDGRKAAQVKVEAQEREDVTTPAGNFKTVRYEADLFNGIIYTRKGRAFVWLTDDARRLPVQMKLRMSFPLGTVTLQMQKPAPRLEVSP